jgi:hypothetical protein
MVTFVISLVVAIPLGVAANLLTPVVRATLAGRSASRRAKRIAMIRRQQELLAEVRAQPSRAAGQLGLMLTRLLPLWAFAVVTTLGSLAADLSTAKGISGLQDVLSVMMPLNLIYSTMATNGTLVMFRKLASPDWADRQAEKQLRKLGAEPELAPEHESGPAPGQEPQPSSR